MTSAVALTDLVGRTTRVADLVVRTRAADWFLPADTLASITGGIRLRSPGGRAAS